MQNTVVHLGSAIYLGRVCVTCKIKVISTSYKCLKILRTQFSLIINTYNISNFTDEMNPFILGIVCVIAYINGKHRTHAYFLNTGLFFKYLSEYIANITKNILFLFLLYYQTLFRSVW